MQSLSTATMGCARLGGLVARPRSLPTTCVAPRRSRRVLCRAAADTQAPTTSGQEHGLSYDHLLCAIMDSNPYLSDGSKQAIAASADLSRLHKSAKVTVLVVDEAKVNPEVRLQNISWHFKERGCDNFEVMEQPGTADSSSSVLLGDVADQVNADLVVLSSEAVHSKYVDANLLAEFVSCPLLLLP